MFELHHSLGEIGVLSNRVVRHSITLCYCEITIDVLIQLRCKSRSRHDDMLFSLIEQYNFRNCIQVAYHCGIWLYRSTRAFTYLYARIVAK